MFSPLEQFEIAPVLFFFKFFEFFGLTINNFSFFSLVFCLFLIVFCLFACFNVRVVPTFRQYILEEFYNFIFSLLVSNLGRQGQRFFPFIFCLFAFILTFNIFGLFPFSFTLASQIVVTCLLAFTTFFSIIYLGVKKHGINVLALFFPSGAPLWLAFLLVPIELISFLSRPFSLAIRLFANMTAGHVLLKILAGFILVLFSCLFGLFLDDILNLKSLFDHQKVILSLVCLEPLNFANFAYVTPVISNFFSIYKKFEISAEVIEAAHHAFVAFRVKTETAPNFLDFCYLLLLSYGYASDSFMSNVLEMLSKSSFNSLFNTDFTRYYSKLYALTALLLESFDISSLVSMCLTTAMSLTDEESIDKLLGFLFLSRGSLDILVTLDKSFYVTELHRFDSSQNHGAWANVAALKAIVMLLKVECIIYLLYGQDTFPLIGFFSNVYDISKFAPDLINNFELKVFVENYYLFVSKDYYLVSTNLLFINLQFVIVFFSLFVNSFFVCCSIVLPIIIIIFFIILEVFVAVVQAYVFSVLTIIYIRDILFLH